MVEQIDKLTRENEVRGCASVRFPLLTLCSKILHDKLADKEKEVGELEKERKYLNRKNGR